jgi:hypothetical protein
MMLGAWWKDYQSECEAILGPQIEGPAYRPTVVRRFTPTSIQPSVRVSDESWGYAGLGIAAAMALVAAWGGWL